MGKINFKGVRKLELKVVRVTGFTEFGREFDGIREVGKVDVFGPRNASSEGYV